MNQEIIASGAVVWQKNNLGQIEIAIVHRPKYDDWSFPKGKIEMGEAVISCAYREVLEETNVETQFGPYLGEVEYMTSEGTKKVFFWSARVIKINQFIPNDEIDKLEWHTIKSAKKILTLESDKYILSKFGKLTLDTNPFVLLRHAKAITRDEWQGDDGDRPLSTLGTKQANLVTAIYGVYKIAEIHTSDAIRCFNTVDEFARNLKISLEVGKELSENSYKKDKDLAINYCKELIKQDKSILICSHNPILPKLLSKLSKKSELDTDLDKLKPASSWIIHRRGKEIIQVDWIDAP